MNKKIALFIIVMLLIAFPNYSQQNNFKNYSTKNGLINSNVTSIFQDSKGFIWFATAGGISRFDGKKFTNYTSRNGLTGNDITSVCEDKQSNMWFGTNGFGALKFDGVHFEYFGKNKKLKSDQIYSIYNDSKGILWICTDEGISKYDGKNFESYSEKNKLPTNNILCVMEDKNHNMWFGTRGLGLCRYDGKSYTIFTKDSGLTGNSVFTLLEDKKGNIWIGTIGGGVNIYDGKKIKDIPLSEEIKKGFIGDLLQDKHNNIWMASDNGLIKYDGKQTYVYTEKQGLFDNTIQALCEDYEGNLWIGTANTGVCFLKNEAIATFTDKEGLTNNKVSSIIQNRNGDYIIGTTGGGINIYNGEQIISFKKIKEISTATINSIEEAFDGKLWVGTTNGIFILNSEKNYEYSISKEIKLPISKIVLKIIKDKMKNIWVAVYGNGIYKIDPQKNTTHFTDSSGLPTNDILTIQEDTKGNIWIGTNQGGVVKYNGEKFTTFTKREGLADNSIWSICEDKKGNLFFGTTEGGVSCYDGKMFTTLSTDDGLCSDRILALIIDNNNNLWVGSDKGINKLQLTDNFQIKSIKYYGDQDGLKSIDIYQNGFYLDKEGLLWIATTNGLTRYNPAYDFINFTPPKLLLTGIRLSHENVDWKKYNSTIDERTKLPLNLSLPYNNNNLTFDFQALTTDNVKYTYLLEGVDKDWVPLTYATEAPYPNIQPGDYTFKVKAINSDGYWSDDVISYSFTINSPFWKTWWFYTSCSLVAVVAVVSFIRTRTVRLEREKKVLEKKVTERTQELQQANNQLSVAYGDIKDSIHYAKKIQEAILPLDSDLKKLFPESFVLFKPRDVVSGDFYWLNNSNNKTFFAAVDCTGHGVPGAFMSMIGNTLLNEIINEQTEPRPASVLDALNIGVRKSLKQDREVFESKDGMDIALCSIDNTSGILEFAGAKRPLYIIRKGGEYLEEVKSDKISIGGMQYEEMQTHFTNHTLQLAKGDTIYIFSDGYADQFGGNRGKKYTTKKLKELVLSIQNYSMQEQREALSAEMEKWKGSLEQIDDILVIGVKL